MEIGEFLELGAGKWFSLRTSYQLDRAEVENSKSDLTVERLARDSSEIIALCQQSNTDASASLGGTKTFWDNSPDWGKPKQTGSAILIFIPDRDRSQAGKLVHAIGTPAKTPISGRYLLGNDEALTFIVEEDNFYLEERLWYASPNLRMRTSLIKQANGFSKTAFYSEIRKLAK